MSHIFRITGLLLLLSIVLIQDVRGASILKPRTGLAGALALQREPAPELEKPHGKLRIFFLDNRHVAVMGDYYDFLIEQINAAYGKRLAFVDAEAAAKRIKDFSVRFLYNFASIDIMSQLHPRLRDAFEQPSHFTLAADGKPLGIHSQGSWIHALGLLRVPRRNPPGGLMMARAAELVHLAYFELDEPLANGTKFQVSTRFGEHAEALFDDRQSLSHAIKVNQEGYLPDAGLKYAYLGRWLGSLGEMPTAQYADRPFHLVEEATGKIVFTGKIAERSPDQSVWRDKVKINLYGEHVMEMDFSSFQTPGSYHIQIPGVGRSWNFVIGPDALGRAFYVQMRGLFQQRSGIAKPPELTGWPIGRDHPYSYRGGFVPNDRHYQGKEARFKNAKGKIVQFKHFEMIAATRTDEKLPDVYGGWWDAGDFDRRTYHFAVVDALLSNYLLQPQKFSDNQLDIPESGNGIPDILDEACWGVDVWRRAQNEKGGVGCWLEATSHPQNPDPEKDVQRYYLALPTRESTLEYSIYAAKLARAFAVAQQPEKSKLFLDSAIRAWDFAQDPANTLKTSFKHPKHGVLTYEEPAELPRENLCKAALNLYLATHDERYLGKIDNKLFDETITAVRQRLGGWFLSELAEDTPHNPALFSGAGKFRKMVIKEANELLKSQQELAYRNINFPLKSAFFTFLGWGNGLPLRKGAFLVLAYRITGDAKYRDAALLAVDWMLGANPMGRTLTTGLGKVYPIRLLSLPNWVMSERLLDPIPGITLYGFNGRVFSRGNASLSMVWTLTDPPRRDHHFNGCRVNLLPRKIYDKTPPSIEAIKPIINATVPLWRRHSSLESYAIEQCEFTVWETMAPAAAVYAALLPDHWQPPPDWKHRQPIRDKNQLPGYYYLP